MASALAKLASLFPGFRPAPTPPPRAELVIQDTKAKLADSTRRGRPPTTEEKVPRQFSGGVAGHVWFLPYRDSATQDTPDIRAAMRLMRRDGYVKAAWEPQVLAVESEDWQVQPAEGGNPESEAQARFVKTALEDYVAGGLRSIVRAVCAPLGSDGFSVAEKVWAYADRGRLAGKLVIKALKAKDGEDIRVEGDNYGNVTSVYSLRNAGAHFPITDFVYSRYLHVFDEPLGEAAFRSAYAAYWMRDTVRKLRVIHHEKKMAGMLVGEYEDDADKGPLETALRAAKTATWMTVPAGVKVQALALTTASETDYKSFDESLRDEIVTAIAFATLQQLVGGSVAGEVRGSAEMQKQVSDLGPWLLMTIVTEAVNTQVIPDLIDFNFPYAAGGYPKLTFGAVSADAILKEQQVVKGAADAGLKPSKKHYAKAWGIQLSDPDDPDDQMQAAPQGPPGMPPGGGGALPFAESPWESFGWQAGKTRAGGTKAVGTGDQAGQTLYGKRAADALAAGGGSDGGGGDGGPGGPPTGGGSESHTIRLPADPRKLTGDQARAALKEMGYEMGRPTSRLMNGLAVTVYELTRPDGTRTTASTDEIRETVYRGAKPAAPAPAPAPAPAEPPHVAELRSKLADADSRLAAAKAERDASAARIAELKAQLAARKRGGAAANAEGGPDTGATFPAGYADPAELLG